MRKVRKAGCLYKGIRRESDELDTSRNGYRDSCSHGCSGGSLYREEHTSSKNSDRHWLANNPGYADHFCSIAMKKRFLRWYRIFGILNFGFMPVDDFEFGPIHFYISSVWFTYFRFALFVKTPWWPKESIEECAARRVTLPEFEPEIYWTFSRRKRYPTIGKIHHIYPRSLKSANDHR
jgi:hypothetical protein